MNKQASCATCGTTKQLLRCAKCKTVYYCSAAHQHMDWLTHKQECRELARQKNNSKQQQQLLQAVVTTSLGNTTMPSMINAKVEYLSEADNNWNDIEPTVWAPEASNDRNFSESERNSIIKRTEPPSCCNHCNGAATCSIIQIPTNTKSLESMNNFTVISCNHQQQRQLLQRKSNAELPPQNFHVVDARPPLISHQHPLNRHTICNNQSERSSSYLISQGDDSITENINERRYEELCRNIINDMNQYGLSVVDDFLGIEKGLQILNEVHHMYSTGEFKDGQLVSNLIAEQDLRTIRGDKITWVKGLEPECANVGYLINQIDAVIFRANTMANNGKLGNYHIRERTKAMVACYPGSGSHYVMHVDNPNRDGRVITAIYYLNVNWDTKRSGGVLRIFPEHGGSVADIEPKFDRLIFFWSDKRNPHEVQPAHQTRYAITVWYFDANEREAALNRCRQYKNNNNKVAVKQAANANVNNTDICT